MTVHAEHATPSTIGSYGAVVAGPSGAPTSQAADYRFWSDLAHCHFGGETEIGLCTVHAQPVPVIGGMERHLHTPELLIPIDAPFVVPVLLDAGATSSPRAFRVDVGEAIVLSAGVWHGACLPVGKNAATYFVIFRRGTPANDVEKKSVPPFSIEGM
jgi:ureidoglycolate hydrolase